jgi:lipopolysaccharide transport system ATP-binding protein
LVLDKGTNTFLGDASSAIEHYLSAEVEIPGELVWKDLIKAPGNHQVRLNAVRIVSDGDVTGIPVVNKDIEIQIDYWNLEENGRRLISIHLFDSMNSLIFATGNIKMATIEPDPWVNTPYPLGLFRSTCVIPKYLLNTGLHTVTLHINGLGAHDNIVLQRNVISFDVQEEIALRSEYLGEWIGTIRPKLDWKTEQLE